MAVIRLLKLSGTLANITESADADELQQTAIGAGYEPASTGLASSHVSVGNGESSGSPSTGTFRGTNASGANIAGASLELGGGASTGNAAGGSVAIRTTPIGTSGSSQNTLQSVYAAYSNRECEFFGRKFITPQFNAGSTEGRFIIGRDFGTMSASATCIGNRTVGSGTNNVAIGHEADCADGLSNTTAVGFDATARVTASASAFGAGANARLIACGYNSVSPAGGFAAGALADGEGSSGGSMGHFARGGGSAMAIGVNTNSGNTCVVVGANITSASRPVIVGYNSSGSGVGFGAVVIGINVSASNNSAKFEGDGDALGYTDVVIGRGVSAANPPANVTFTATDASGLTNTSGSQVLVASGNSRGSASGAKFTFRTGVPTTSGSTVQSMATRLTLYQSFRATFGNGETATSPQSSVIQTTSAAATGSITAVAKASLIDGETFTISDGTTSKTFEFDVSGNGVGGGNVAVDVSNETTAKQVASRIRHAINQAGFNIKAPVARGAVVELVNIGTSGYTNVTITETVSNAGFVVSGMTGGTDTAGADFTIAGGRSTGNAAGGSLVFQTSPAGGSGTTLNALSNAMQLFSTLRAQLFGEMEIDGDFNHDGSNAGFFGTAPAAKPTVTGSKASNAALGSLMTAVSNLGLFTDSTT